MSTTPPPTDPMDTDQLLSFGLFPEKMITSKPHIQDISHEEVKGYMEEVLEIVRDKVDEAWPGHAGMSKDELVNWVHLSTTFMSVDDINNSNFSTNITCAVLLLYFHWQKFELKDLASFIATARYVYTSNSYNSISYNYSFTSLLIPIIARLYSV